MLTTRISLQQQQKTAWQKRWRQRWWKFRAVECTCDKVIQQLLFAVLSACCPSISGCLIGSWVGSQRSCEVSQRVQANTKVTKCVRLGGGAEADLLLGVLTKKHQHVNSQECQHSSPTFHPPWRASLMVCPLSLRGEIAGYALNQWLA